MSSEEESKIKQAAPKSGLETGSLARPSDSNIKQAQPKQGLETGGLVSGKAKVAMEYAKSLSGAEGPEAMFDAVDEIAAKRAEQAINRLSFAGRGGAAIFGVNGSFSVVSRQTTPDGGSRIEEESQGLLPWDIVTSGEEFGIAVGTIYKSFGSVNDADTFTITDFDLTFTPSATTVVYLELDNLSTPTITLKAGAAWTEHPETFKLTTTGVVKAEKAFFRLWHGVSGNKPANAFGIQYDGFWMKKTFRSNDLVLGYGSYELDDTHRHIAVPVLFPM
jgi:hypothetical protein